MEGEDEPWQFSMFVYADEYDGATAACRSACGTPPSPLEPPTLKSPQSFGGTLPDLRKRGAGRRVPPPFDGSGGRMGGR